MVDTKTIQDEALTVEYAAEYVAEHRWPGVNPMMVKQIATEGARRALDLRAEGSYKPVAVLYANGVIRGPGRSANLQWLVPQGEKSIQLFVQTDKPSRHGGSPLSDLLEEADRAEQSAYARSADRDTVRLGLLISRLASAIRNLTKGAKR